MQTAFAAHPLACVHACSTWDVAQLLGHLLLWGDIQDLSFRQLAYRTVALFFLLFSYAKELAISLICQCLSLFVLFKFVVLQFGKRLKQDYLGHSSPLIYLHRALDEAFCPICQSHSVHFFVCNNHSPSQPCH